MAAVVFLSPFVLPEARASDLLDAAREELRAARVPEKEIRLRLRIIENVSTVKAYFPHADGGRPETRNSKYWKTNEDGTYVPRGRPVESVRDLWRTVSGIRCAKLSALVMIKAMIDEADEKRGRPNGSSRDRRGPLRAV